MGGGGIRGLWALHIVWHKQQKLQTPYTKEAHPHALARIPSPYLFSEILRPLDDVSHAWSKLVLVTFHPLSKAKEI
jgi:hypothetical protein